MELFSLVIPSPSYSAAETTCPAFPGASRLFSEAHLQIALEFCQQPPGRFPSCSICVTSWDGGVWPPNCGLAVGWWVALNPGKIRGKIPLHKAQAGL